MTPNVSTYTQRMAPWASIHYFINSQWRRNNINNMTTQNRNNPHQNSMWITWHHVFFSMFVLSEFINISIASTSLSAFFLQENINTITYIWGEKALLLSAIYNVGNVKYSNTFHCIIMNKTNQICIICSQQNLPSNLWYKPHLNGQ